MSDFGIFESAIVADDAPAQMAKQASRQLQAAIYDVGQTYGPFLLAATGKDEFEDRWHYSKKDIRKTIEPHLLPVTGVMRRVHNALKQEYAQRLADKTEPEQHIQETFHPSEGDLHPSSGRGAFERYKDSVDQGGPEKVEAHDFGVRSGEDDWENTGRQASRMALDLYTDWAHSNGLRVASVATLELYSPNCSPGEFRFIDAAIRQAGEVPPQFKKKDEEEHEESEDHDDEDDKDEDDKDKGHDEGNKDKGDDDSDDDDKDDGGPPWLKDSIRRVGWGGNTGADEPALYPGIRDFFTTDPDKVTGGAWGGAGGGHATPAPAPGQVNRVRGPSDNPGAAGAHNTSGATPGADQGTPLGSQAEHHGVGGGFSGPGDAGKALGTGGGYGGAGFQSGDSGTWNKSTETSGIAGGGDYTVKPGETLGDIANRAGVDVSTLKTQSGDPNLIRPGEKISVPGSTDTAKQPSPNVGGQVTQGGKPLADVNAAAVAPAAAPVAPVHSSDAALAGVDMSHPTTPDPSQVTQGTVIKSSLGSYFRDYYGIQRLAAEDDEGGPDDSGGGGDGGGGGAPPPDPSQQQAPPDPSQMGGAPPPDPSQMGGAPPPTENQPAEDALLDTASQAVSQMMQRETQEFQQIMGPLNQALQAIQFAQQVEQQEHPIDVSPPQGSVDVGPQSAGPMAQQPQQPQQMTGSLDEDAVLQHRAQRIASVHGMTRVGYEMVLAAMDDRHYQEIAEAVSILPPSRRMATAASLADLFKSENPDFRAGAFLNYADAVPVSRLGFNRGRQADAGSLAQTQVMDAWEPPGTGARHISDDIALTKDNMGVPSALKIKIKPKKAKSLEKAWEGFTKSRADQGLDTSDIVDMAAFKETNPNRSEKSLADLGAKIGIPPTAPVVSKSPTGGGKMFKPPGGPKTIKPPGVSGGGSRKKGSFFTRRVDGWQWNDHLAAYTASAPNPFTCDCGTSIEVPSYHNCRCGKVYNSYVIGSGGDGRTAAIDMFLCREVPVREGMTMEASRKQAVCEDCVGTAKQLAIENLYDQMRGDGVDHATAQRRAFDPDVHGPEAEYYMEDPEMLGHGQHVLDRMASRRTACCGCGHDPCSCPDTDWYEDDELESQETPHAPYKNAAIGEDDHKVVYRDGERFCSQCDALLWDPNVHHCPVRQAAIDDDYDESTVSDSNEGHKDHTLSKGMRERVRKGEGTSGSEVERHVKNDKESRRRQADWTRYDDGTEETPPHSTEMGPFTDDWAQRGGPDPRKPSSQWRGPTFQRRQRH